MSRTDHRCPIAHAACPARQRRMVQFIGFLTLAPAGYHGRAHLQTRLYLVPSMYNISMELRRNDPQEKLVYVNNGCTSKNVGPLIILNLRILTYFNALITNIIMKIGANFIFMTKTIKNSKSRFFPFTSINNGYFEKYFMLDKSCRSH